MSADHLAFAPRFHIAVSRPAGHFRDQLGTIVRLDSGEYKFESRTGQPVSDAERMAIALHAAEARIDDARLAAQLQHYDELLAFVRCVAEDGYDLGDWRYGIGEERLREDARRLVKGNI